MTATAVIGAALTVLSRQSEHTQRPDSANAANPRGFHIDERDKKTNL